MQVGLSLLGAELGAVELDDGAVLYLGHSTLISIVSALILYLPQQCLGPCSFPESSAASVFCFLDDSHFEWGEMESQSGFDLHFPHS